MGDVVDPCEYLSIGILLDELEQLTVYDLDARNFISVLIQYLILSQDLVLLSDVFLGKSLLELISALLKLLDQLVEPFVNVASLLLIQSLDFLFYMLNELAIVIVYALGIKH